MKKFLTALFVVISAIYTQIQAREIMPVDWKKVAKVAKSNPDSIRKLANRLSTEQIDTTLTWEERILAIYGETYLSDKGNELQEAEIGCKDKGKYKEACTVALNVLKENPLNIRAVSLLVSTHKKLSDNEKKELISDDEVKVIAKRMMRVLNTIAITGDGTKEKPFYVTEVNDEYLFMKIYLELSGIQSQTLIWEPMPEDVFELSGTSEYWREKTICFEVSRVLEMESEALGISNKK